MRSVVAFTSVALLAIAFARDGQAAFSYNAPWSTYSQNFDTLPTTPINATLGNSPVGWTNDNAAPGAGNFSILGWYLWHPTSQAEGGFNGRQRMRIGSGNANTGAFMSFGVNNVAERALGSLASNTTTPTPNPPNALPEQYIGLRLNNNTGSVLTTFTFSYFGEQWRDGGDAVPNAQSLLAGYKLTAAGAGPLVQDSGFTSLAAANFTSPVFTNTGAGAAVNGNTVGRVGIGPVTVSGLKWLPGTDLWIRWADQSNVGNDHGLAIDDFSFIASTPEPASVLVWGCVALIGVAGLRRFR